MQVTIIVPSRDQYLPLKETLRTLGHQSFKDWELIVVDMGSIDGSQSLLRSFGSGKAVSFVSVSSNNLFHALNVGLARAKGEFVFVLEPGDRFINKDSLALIFSQMKGKSLGLLAYKNLASGVTEPCPYLDHIKEHIKDLDCPPCSLLFSTRWLRSQGGFDESFTLLAHKKLLIAALSSFKSSDVARVDEPLVARDAGNPYYLHQYASVKLKEAAVIEQMYSGQAAVKFQKTSVYGYLLLALLAGPLF